MYNIIYVQSVTSTFVWPFFVIFIVFLTNISLYFDMYYFCRY